MDIPLLPETQEDRHLAHLLALKPAYDITEKQAAVRMSIINSPALPSSSGLITSFGGLKTERLLSQSRPLSRSILGISIKSSSSKNVTKPKTSATVVSPKEIDKSTNDDNSIINNVGVIVKDNPIVDESIEMVQSTNDNDVMMEKDLYTNKNICITDDTIVIAKDTTTNCDDVVIEKNMSMIEKDITTNCDDVIIDKDITTNGVIEKDKPIIGIMPTIEENDSHIELDNNKRKIENDEDSGANKKPKISLVCDYDSSSSSDS